MEKEKSYKIKFTEEELMNLEAFKEAFGMPITVLVRKAVNEYLNKFNYAKENNMKILYVEETTRKTKEFHSIDIWKEDALREMLSHQIKSDNEKKIDALVNRINAGEEIVFDGVYVTKYRVASDEDIIKNRTEKEKEDTELDEMDMSPENIKKIAEALHRLTENI